MVVILTPTVLIVVGIPGYSYLSNLVICLLNFTDGQDLNKWIAATFSGRTIAINDQHVTPVTAEDVSKYDAWDVSLMGWWFKGVPHNSRGEITPFTHVFSSIYRG